MYSFKQGFSIVYPYGLSIRIKKKIVALGLFFHWIKCIEALNFRYKYIISTYFRIINPQH